MKMKTIKKYLINRNYVLAVTLTLLLTSACTDLLDEPLENQDIAENIDYSQPENMILMLYGAYADFNALQWETFPIISVRGDDVNAAGDQFPLQETDEFRYDRNFWMYNSNWLNIYSDVLYWHGAMETIDKYKEAGANAATAEQYKAELKCCADLKCYNSPACGGAFLYLNLLSPAICSIKSLYPLMR
jgi:hypothetical protein